MVKSDLVLPRPDTCCHGDGRGEEGRGKEEGGERAQEDCGKQRARATNNMSAVPGRPQKVPLPLNTFLMTLIQLVYLPGIMYFGLPVSVSCPVNRNVNDEECLPLVSASRGCTSLLSVQNDVHMNQRDAHLSCQFRMTFTRTKGMYISSVSSE